MLRRDQDAAASTFAFLVAAVLFTGTLALLLLTTQNAVQGPGDVQPGSTIFTTPPPPPPPADADDLLAFLLEDPGSVPEWSHLEGGACVTVGDVDALAPAQLQNASSPLFADWCKVRNLQRAQAGPAPADGRVNYDELLADVQAGIGLDPTLDFHLRSFPTSLAAYPPAAPLDLAVGYVDAGLDATFGPQEQDALLAVANGTLFQNYTDAAAIAEGLAGDLDADALDVLVVGSEAQHALLDAGSLPNAVRNWVGRGGLLVVLGSDATDEGWLAPLLAAYAPSSSNHTLSPDPNHPLLLVPNNVAIGSYNGTGGDLALGAADGGFTTVVQPAGDPPLLRISKAGSFGNGTVILARLHPHEDCSPGVPPLVPPTSCDGGKLLHNLVVQRAQGLFLDYGPALPAPATAATATRLMAVPDLGLTVSVTYRGYVF